MRKTLVTGGAGFLGLHLCDRLIARGEDVLCVDNFFAGSKANVKHLFSNLGEYTMFELAETVLSIVGSKSKIVCRLMALGSDNRIVAKLRVTWAGSLRCA